MNSLRLSSLLLLVLSASACSYRVEKEALPKVELDPLKVTFTEIQSAILGPKCSRCHGWTASHADVTSLLGEIQMRISSAAPTVMMPPPGNARLSAEEIAAIQGWAARGAPLGSGVPAPPSPEPPPVNPPPRPQPVVPRLTYESVRQQVFLPKCNRCHSAMVNSYEKVVANLGEIESRVRSTMDFDQMPPPDRAPPLTDDEKTLLLDWIQAGAPEHEPQERN